MYGCRVLYFKIDKSVNLQINRSPVPTTSVVLRFQKCMDAGYFSESLPGNLPKME
jgi:hypothetical protein